jgi:hypothetical protein
LTAYWKPLIPIVVMRIVLPLIEYLSPILLGALLDYIQDATGGTEAASQSPLSSSTEKPLIYGLAIAFSIFAVQVASSILFANNLRTMYLLSTEIKSALVAMIYRKSLRLSPDSRRKSSTGAITNHMSVDADLWEEGTEALSMWISLPVDIVLCLYLCK